jgi:uncharacterized protein (TIGR03067 family)
MKLALSLVGLLALSFATFAGDAPAADGKALEGVWLPVKAELGGRPMADEVLKTITLRLDNGKYEVHVGDEPDRGTYTFDATTQPHSMSVTGTDGVNRGKTFPAIYELKGDTLRICYDLSGKKRPTEFKTAAGTKLYLVTYSRGKK